MKKSLILFACLAMLGCSGTKSKPSNEQNQPVNEQTMDAKPKVYFTQEISPAALVRVYEAVGRPAQGKVAVKISTGEAGGHNYLQPKLIQQLVSQVNGTLVECNTAYEGKRNTTEAHWQTIKDHGFLDIAPVDLMDEEGDFTIPVQDSTWIKYDRVGTHLKNYDFLINLAHFKGHAMGGFGGVLKNQSIGVASAAGKAYIHSAGITEDVVETWSHTGNQDGFLESMAAAAQAVHNYFGNGEKIMYINVVNNLSVDCDCDSHPADPEMADIGILASTDPVALDQACLDLVFNYPSKKGDDASALIERINSRHGVHTVEHAAKIGLGKREYELVQIDGQDLLKTLNENGLSLLVRNHGTTTMHQNKGVRDLLQLLADQPDRLKGAVVADKMIGKAAAALMIEGGVKEVHTNLICSPALKLLNDAKVKVVYAEEVPMILNRDRSGQCPIDSQIDGVESLSECLKILHAM
ncbi:MAG: DUF1893 domain-containing protein [Paludibacteraceae bacterium]|nr:DUF1893 domain-containing protein [Paludibacteraceae bacterium]